MPPRSTNAPKFTTDDTTPLRTSPGLRLARKSSRCSFCVSSSHAATRQHDVVAVLVELDDLRLRATAADVGLQVAHAAQLDERRGQEAAEADVEDEAALDDLDDRAFDDAVRLLDLLDGAPGPLVLRPLLRQDQAALLVLLLEDERLESVAQRHDLGGVDVVADRQLARRDDALGLVADVEQDLVLVDLDDRARRRSGRPRPRPSSPRRPRRTRPRGRRPPPAAGCTHRPRRRCRVTGSSTCRGHRRASEAPWSAPAVNGGCCVAAGSVETGSEGTGVCWSDTDSLSGSCLSGLEVGMGGFAGRNRYADTRRGVAQRPERLPPGFVAITRNSARSRPGGVCP